MTQSSDSEQKPRPAAFATTHWSVVRAAGDASSAEGREALETLCSHYWFPLYAYLRRHNYSRHDAEDYIQGFFARLLEKGYLGQVQPGRGKFRSFLLACLKHFVANERKRAGARKRGGAHRITSLDFESAEHRYTREPASEMTPERAYERSWAITLLDRAMVRLEQKMGGRHSSIPFEYLKPYLVGDPQSPQYGELAGRLEVTDNAIRVAVHRLRREFRAILRDEIAQTVLTQDEVDQEIRQLVDILGQ